jgi:hypothetical protein
MVYTGRNQNATQGGSRDPDTFVGTQASLVSLVPSQLLDHATFPARLGGSCADEKHFLKTMKPDPFGPDIRRHRFNEPPCLARLWAGGLAHHKPTRSK